MKKFTKLILSVSMLFASTTVIACSSNGSSGEGEIEPEEALPCYRLTWIGAEMANNALLQKKRNKNTILSRSKKCGIYPKKIDGEEIDQEDIEEASETPSSISLAEGEGYKGNEIIDTRNQDLPLLINSSMLTPNFQDKLDGMFIIGNHRGGILGGNYDNADWPTLNNAILYPSTTLSSEELASYDLDAAWTSDSKKKIQEDVYNHEQKTVVNYKLVDNSGTLSSNNKSIETNMHFSVVLRNTEPPIGGIVDAEFGYDIDPEELKEELEATILASFQSRNKEATLWVKLTNENGTEKTISDIANEKAAKIAEARITKEFSPWIINFVVGDSDGNEAGWPAYVTLNDKVAPVIKKDGKVVEKIELGDGKGIQLCTLEKFIEGAKELAKEKGYTFEDDIFGTIDPNFTITEDGKLSYSFVDGLGNATEWDIDESLFIKDFEDANDRYYAAPESFASSPEWKYIDIGEYRYYIGNYFGFWEFGTNYKPLISVASKEFAAVDERDWDYTKRCIFDIEPVIVNEGTVFEEKLVPHRARGLSSWRAEGKDGVIIINAPIVFGDWLSSELRNTDSKNHGVLWLCKDVVMKQGAISNIYPFDIYLEDSEENATNTEKYFSDPKHSDYWYGDVHSTLHWGTSLAEFKAKYEIE